MKLALYMMYIVLHLYVEWNTQPFLGLFSADLWPISHSCYRRYNYKSLLWWSVTIVWLWSTYGKKLTIKLLSSNFPRLRTFSRFFFSSDLFSSGLLFLWFLFLRLNWQLPCYFREKSPKNLKQRTLFPVSIHIFSRT